MNDLSHLSDVTSFRKVLNAIDRDPELQGFINVGDENLGLVAGMMEEGDLSSFEPLVKEGKISSRPTDPDNAVDVIYLPPFYVLKDRGVKFT